MMARPTPTFNRGRTAAETTYSNSPVHFMMSIVSLVRRVSVRQAALFGLAAALFFQAGCNRQTNVKVTGTVLRGGQPLKVSPTGVVRVMLKPDVGEGEPFTPKMGDCDRETGKFEIPDVRPGKYKIGVQQFDPTPQVDKLNGGFVPDKGKIVREIDGKTPLTIDLDKPE
jgi:hypothetical protein